MLLSLVIKTNPTAEKCTYRVKCYNFAPSNARLRGKILFIELKVQNYWPFILPNIYKFHHPGSGRKQTIPFPKGRQPTESRGKTRGDSAKRFRLVRARACTRKNAKSRSEFAFRFF